MTTYWRPNTPLNAANLNELSNVYYNTDACPQGVLAYQDFLSDQTIFQVDNNTAVDVFTLGPIQYTGRSWCLTFEYDAALGNMWILVTAYEGISKGTTSLAQFYFADIRTAGESGKYATAGVQVWMDSSDLTVGGLYTFKLQFLPDKLGGASAADWIVCTRGTHSSFYLEDRGA